MSELLPNSEIPSAHTVKIDKLSKLSKEDKIKATFHDVRSIIAVIYDIGRYYGENLKDLSGKPNLKDSVKKLNNISENFTNTSAENPESCLSIQPFILALKAQNEYLKENFSDHFVIKDLENVFSKDDKKMLTENIKNNFNKNVNLLSQEIEEIQDVMDIDKYPINKEIKDLNIFIPELLDKIKEEIFLDSHHIKFIPTIGNSIYQELDTRLTKKVIENFICNSIKYSPLNTNIMVGVNQTEEETKIFVKDFGIGLSSSELNYFSSQDESREQSEYIPGKKARFAPKEAVGTGFGIYNAATYAARQGAGLEAFSSGKNKGAGSTFSLVFKR